MPDFAKDIQNLDYIFWKIPKNPAKSGEIEQKCLFSRHFGLRLGRKYIQMLVGIDFFLLIHALYIYILEEEETSGR